MGNLLFVLSSFRDLATKRFRFIAIGIMLLLSRSLRDKNLLVAFLVQLAQKARDSGRIVTSSYATPLCGVA